MAVPIVLVPGFWLGAWAWEEVAALLGDRGYDVRAITLPGLEAVDIDRSAITLEDHVGAICDAVTSAGDRVMLAVHSGASAAGYAATDRIPDRIAAMVYVDTAPGNGAIDADFADVERPMPPLDELAASENLDDVSEEQLDRFRRLAVPEPGGVIRDTPRLENDRRLDIPSTVICTGFTAEQYREAAAQGLPWMNGLSDLHDVRYIDLPTSHWPMWSQPDALVDILARVADEAS
jgi:pimeloyl-ACP methyl ester carboxylesterase